MITCMNFQCAHYAHIFIIVFYVHVFRWIFNVLYTFICIQSYEYSICTCIHMYSFCDVYLFIWIFNLNIHRDEFIYISLIKTWIFRLMNLKCICISDGITYIGLDELASQVYTRDTRLPVPLCVMASSAMGLNMRVFGVLPTTHTKSNAKQVWSQSSHSDRSTGR